ncbi:MAG: DUF58 domain-containing protein [Bacteroidia bacterium]|nr:DUF58 domain-containing protein [Bacteroidia bacterium]
MKNILEIQELQQFENLELIARQVVEGFITGLHRSPFHGFSVEFAEHRLYNKGESTKHIDWKLYARTDKLFVKKFEEETNLRSHIVIDTSSSMLFPFEEKKIINKLAFSAYCAAALIYMLRKQRDAVGLALFSNDIELLTATRLSSVHAKMLYNELSNLLNAGEAQLLKKNRTPDVLHQIAEKIHRRSLIIIFSDMIDNEDPENLFSALQHLRYNKHEVILFHTIDKRRETMLEFTNRPYKFIDMETGEDVRFNPNELRDDYKRLIKAHFDELKLRCSQYNIDIIEVDILKDFKNVLLSYLIKRSKLY